MSWERRGEAVAGQVEWHMLSHRLWSEEWRRRAAEQQATEARDGPSKRLRMCESMISGCKVGNPAVAPPADGGGFISFNTM